MKFDVPKTKGTQGGDSKIAKDSGIPQLHLQKTKVTNERQGNAENFKLFEKETRFFSGLTCVWL